MNGSLFVEVPSGDYPIGSDHDYPEERPARTVRVESFRLQRHPVTVGQFAEFVRATGHRTTAESLGSSNVFVAPPGPVDLADASQWWRVVAGASWLAPFGPGSAATPDVPVTHVSHRDAVAYCEWAGVRLPGEVEWEAAAGSPRPASWPFDTDGRLLANVWVGRFPWDNRRPDPPGPQAVGRFGLDAAGFADLLGNVWEWTATEWDHGRHVLKGGSFLCAADHCRRYRPSARLPQHDAEPACHIGFRVASR